MKKHLLLTVRLLVAAGGIGYIAYSLTWVDHVVLPAGTALPGRPALTEPLKVRVDPADVERFDPSGELRLHLPPDALQDGAPATKVTITRPAGETGRPFEFTPGILTMIRRARVGLLVGGAVMVGMIYIISTVRWWLLMRARHLEVTLWNALRLSMVGCFFNYCMPGTTGGDLVKAFYAAKGSGQKTDAVISIVVDRIVGVLGLVVLAGVAGLFMLDNEVAAREVTFYIWGLMALLVLGAAVYFSRVLRRLLRLEQWLFKLPGGSLLKKIDDAAVAYRDHKAALLIALALSVSLHFCLSTGTALAGYSLGMQRPLGLLLTIVPIIFFGGAVPVSYQGLGIMEAIGKPLLVEPPMCTMNQLIGMLLLVRLYQIAFSTTGALFLLKGDIHMHPQVESAQMKHDDIDALVDPTPDLDGSVPPTETE